MARRTHLVQPATSPDRFPVEIKRKGVNSLDPMLRRAVLKETRGDATRVEVLSPTEARVHNKPVI